MKKSLLVMVAFLTALLSLSGLPGVHAQDTGPVLRISYYLAADSDGVQQVYQYPLDEQSEPRQITHAESNIITFNAAYDGLSVAYVSAGQLWLQPIHTDESEALAPLSATQFFSSPVFSQDGQYIAYADNGVWLLDLGTRETRQLLADVPLDASASNAGEFRIYQPELFVLDNDRQISKLIVDVGIWEWNTVGVYDLASGELQELEGQVHTNLLPLSGGRVLLYGNGGVAGEPALHIAESLDDINNFTEVVSFRSLTDATLFAEQAVEIRLGVVRIFGPALAPESEGALAFYFDFDVQAGTAGSVNFAALAAGDESGNPVPGRLSPDGSLVPVYLNALWTDFGSIYGDFELLDLEAHETVAAEFPETVGVFHWQP
jgi:hypothetical protein